ncbi:MAG: FHA domain-containing protein [Synechococcales bacterium]|nr:FHA domain-containing protein [Synechococcales bacterium]
MITLLLLHPLKRTPIQVWPFKGESIIRIGRSTDNDVILYSAVVSRHHVELRKMGSGWEIVNLGTNGTYLDGKRIMKVAAEDGSVIRLARSGPNIQIRLGPEVLKELPDHLVSDRSTGQRFDHQPTVTDVTNPLPDEQLNHETDLEQKGGTELGGQQPTGQSIIPVPSHLRPISAPPDADRRESLPNAPIVIQQTDEAGNLHQSVGGYQLLQVLGQGHIGLTYLARRDARQFVLKTLNSSWANHEQAWAALEMEAELLQQLQHPKIPGYVDYFMGGGQPYLVMDWVPGQSLANYVATQGAVDVERAIAWLLEICEILSYLHGFLPPLPHRNLEPANFILKSRSLINGAIPNNRADGDLVLIGFGTIKSIVLELGRSVGSSGYIPPAQLETTANPQVDLYALAPLLVHLVTGQNPVAFCDREDGRSYQFNPRLVPGLSSSLVAILERLTRAEVGDRYTSVTEVEADLRNLLCLQSVS